MKRLCLLCLALAFAASLGGCASNADPEERAFFYSGWLKPNKSASTVRELSY